MSRLSVHAIKQKPNNRLLFSTILAIVFCSICLKIAAAQEEISWTEPVLLSGTIKGSNPQLLIDEQSGEHVFWAEYPTGEIAGAIYYQALINRLWSDPIDIIITSGSTGFSFDAKLDNNGWVHLVWDSDLVYYSRAEVSSLALPNSWSDPVAISDHLSDSPNIAIDPQGNIHVVYIDRESSPYVRYTSSNDDGETWQQPMRVSEPVGSAYAIDVSLIQDRSGMLYIAWAENIEIFPPSGIYFSLSTDAGNTWSEPQSIVNGGYRFPSLGLDKDNNIHLFWTGTGDWAGKYHTYSTEGGTSWSSTEQLWPGTAGFLGFADFELDPRGNLHMVTAVNSQTLFDVRSPGEIFHTIWLGDTWSEPGHLTESMIRTEYENQFPDMAISEDGQIHVVWHTIDHSSQSSYVWYSTTDLPMSETGGDVSPTNNFPKENLVPTPTVKSPTPTMQVLRGSPTPPTTPAQNSLQEMINTDVELPNPWLPIGTGISLIVFFLISVVLFVRLWRR